MISKKIFQGDGNTNRFLSDFIIRSENFARPYVFIHDDALSPDGTEDVLQDGTIDQANWSYPDNLWRRGGNTAKSEDLVTVDNWSTVDNSILFFDAPPSGTTVWLEVATTAGEFGDTLVAPSVKIAEEAADRAVDAANRAKDSELKAKASENNALVSEINAKESETNAKTSEINAGQSEAAALVSELNAKDSENNAKTSELNAKTSETNAAASAAAALVSENNAKTSEINAATSANNAAQSAQEAEYYAQEINDMKGSFGRLSSPLLDLPLKNSLAMKAGVGSVTFIRSTTATYIDRYGVLQTAGVDEPRFEKDGLLIEAGSTNIVLNSNTCSYTSDAPAVNASVVIVSGGAPDGTSNILEYIEDTSTQIGHYFSINSLATDLIVGETVTFSIFVKNKPTGSMRYPYIVGRRGHDGISEKYAIQGFDLSAGTASFSNSDVSSYSIREVGNGWYRISVTYTLVGDILTGNQIGQIRWQPAPDLGIAVYDGDGVSGGYCFGVQLEKKPAMSSYIPTIDTQVTRTIDAQHIDNLTAYVLPDFSKAFSIYTEHTYQGTDGLALINQFNSIQTNDGLSRSVCFRCEVLDNRYSLLYKKESGGQDYTVSGGSLEIGKTCKLLVTYDGVATLKLYIDGELVSTNNNIDNSLLYHERPSMFKFSGWASNTSFGPAGFSNRGTLKVYDYALTDTEAKLLAGGQV